MTILEKIVAHKKIEVEQRQQNLTIQQLEQDPLFNRKGYSLATSLRQGEQVGIISEFKRKSPSKGIINGTSTVQEVTQGYVNAGVSGLSVLTDEHFFGGQTADLIAARNVNQIPILRKDFIVGEYQLFEAKVMGADVILLIAECLDKKQVKALSTQAKNLGLEVLMEVHSIEQLDKLCDTIDIVGVNNRNLKTFEVSLQTSYKVGEQIPKEFVKISESGISDPNSIIALKKEGFKGFLIGETFMKTSNPALTCKKFIESILISNF